MQDEKLALTVKNTVKLGERLKHIGAGVSSSIRCRTVFPDEWEPRSSRIRGCAGKPSELGELIDNQPLPQVLKLP